MDITLRFAHCRCEAAPISVLGYEEFPRVRTLILYVGIHDPEETHTRRQHRCAPSAKFFRPLVDGMSFPHLKHLQVRHYWATIPPATASLETDLRRRTYMPQNCFDQIGPLDGLQKLESIVLESPPELDSAVLMQLVRNPKAVASNLTVLDLRFCELDSETIAQLLYHAPPKLARLSLLCVYDNHESRHHHPDHSGRAVTPYHLCPLVRQFGKRLVHLDFGAAHICRQLFFDEEEMQSLRECGTRTKVGGNGGLDLEKLDEYAVRQTIRHVRDRRHVAAREEAHLGQTLDIVHASDQPPHPNPVSKDSLHNVDADSLIRPSTDISLGEEEQQRHRWISRSDKKSFRRFIAWQGLCDSSDTWTEMMLAADMEEIGVELVLASTLIAYLANPSHGTLADAISRQKPSSRQSSYHRRVCNHARL